MRRLPALAVAGLIILGVLVLAVAILYSQRGTIGAQLATAYLRDRGIASTIVVERLDPGGFTGSAVLGDPNDPDLVVKRMEVEFEPIPLFKSGLAAPRIRSIHLIEPKLKARWDGKKLTFGSLQPLIDDAAGAPGAGPGPTVVIERGQARLSTPAGALRLDGDGRLDRGRLATLAASLQPATLRQGDFSAQLAGATIRAVTRDSVIVATLHLDVRRAAKAGASVEALKADLTGQIPYAQTFSLDGPVSLDLKAAASALSSGPQKLLQPQLSLALAGAATGPLERLTLKGSGTGSLAAAALTAPGAAVQKFDLAGRITGFDLARVSGVTRISLDSDLNGVAARVTAAGVDTQSARMNAQLARIEGVIDSAGGNFSLVPSVTASAQRTSASGLSARTGVVDLTSTRAVLDWRQGGWSLSGPIRSRTRVASLVQPILAGDLTLRTLSLDLSGQAAVGSGPPRFDLTGSARSQGGALSPAAARAFAAALPLIGTDPVGEAAILAAFRTARLDAPAFTVRSDARGLSLALPRPLQLAGVDGARAVVSALDGAPLAASSAAGLRGGLVARLSGARLPELSVEVPAYTAGLDRGGLTLQAQTRLTAAFTGETLHDLKLSAPARLVRTGGLLSATLEDCAPVSLAAFGQTAMPLLTTITAKACPDPAQPVLSLGPSSWRFSTQLQDFQADAPAGEAQIRTGRGLVELRGSGGGAPTGYAQITTARVLDGAAMKRFEPLGVTGRIDLAHDVWTGPIQLATAAKGRPLATVQVTHAMTTAIGGADIAAPALTFAKDSLQPGELSPLAATLATDAEGTVSFAGRADWSPAGGVTSHGRLTTKGVDFRSQFGLVQHASADIAFTSLAPLVSAPDQPVAADGIAWLVPLKDATARIGIREDRMAIDMAKAKVAGGEVVLDPLDLLYAPNSPMSGVVRLTQIDLGALIEQFNLADKLTLDARIDGVVPFAFTNGALRLDKGHVFATGPGRLSLKREALTGATASDTPGAPVAPTAGMQDIAYQALENLAFDKLEADIVSQPMGRLGILFKINGRNDPPGGGETRISLFDLIRGKAFDKPLALPKGTPVNLTLDTSLNFDELLAAYNNRGRSEPVQPAPPKTDPAK